MSGMSTSSHTHHSFHAVPTTRRGWFAVAVAATAAAVVVSTVVAAAVGLGWAAVSLVVLVGAAGAGLASRSGRDAVVGYLAGTAATMVGLYATVLGMAQFYMVAVQH
jgi:hypothetical protein